MKKIIKNVEILTMDDRQNYYKNGVLIYEDDTIVYVGPTADEAEYDLTDAEVTDGNGMLVMPGFVNAHCHTAMTLFRGRADDLPLWEWLSERIWPMEDKLTPEEAYRGSMLGIAEMIRSGITTFSDMYMFTLQTAQAVIESGIRAVLARGLAGPDENTDKRHGEIEELYQLTKDSRSEGRLHMMIGPHAVYTCSPDYLKTCGKLAQKYNTGIHVHMSETEKEVADCVREYGRTPVRHLREAGIFESPTVAAHCVHVTHDDMNIMAECNVKAVHCPSSNMKLASGFAPVQELLSKGICVALGTDGAASNNNLSIMKEMSLAALISKGHTGDPRSLPAMDALRMATIEGARALMLDKETGSLEPGKKADIIMMNTNQPHYLPKGDNVVNLVYSGYTTDVETVIINGRTVMKNRILTTIDIDK